MTPAPALFTFGYEGLAVEGFVARLKQAMVSTLVDVRQLPLSRKKGFSKSALRNHLAVAGIGYVHLPALGCPKSIRDRYRQDGDWQRYTHDFMAHLDTVVVEVQALAAMARTDRLCLVCFEADFTQCHRTYVARAAHALGAPVVQHLTARTAIADQPVRLAA